LAFKGQKIDTHFGVLRNIKSHASEWITDKSGVKITDLIIDPLLVNTKTILMSYVKRCGQLHDGTKVLSDEEDDDENDSSDSSNDCDSDFENESTSDDNTDSNTSDSDSETSSDKKEKPKLVKYDTSRMGDKILVDNMDSAMKIRLMIDNKTLHDKVLKYICPFFKLNIFK